MTKILVLGASGMLGAELLRSLAAGMNRLSRLFAFPPGLLRTTALMLGKADLADRLLGSLQVNSGRIRRELNWTPPFSLNQGLRATAEQYCNVKKDNKGGSH